MKKLICISLCIVAYCDAADPYARWHQAVAHAQFQPIEEAQVLDLFARDIINVPNLNLPELRKLELGSNKIETVPNFDHLPALEELGLDYNKLTEVPNFNLPALKKLGLGLNELAGVPNFDLPALETLDLSRNDLTAIPSFDHLPALKTLDLNNNELTAMPELNVPTLKLLDLAYNKIDSIDPKLFKQLPHLKELILNGNWLNSSQVEWLKNQLKESHPDLKIIAYDLRQHEDIPGLGFGAKRKGIKQPTPEEEK